MIVRPEDTVFTGIGRPIISIRCFYRRRGVLEGSLWTRELRRQRPLLPRCRQSFYACFFNLRMASPFNPFHHTC